MNAQALMLPLLMVFVNCFTAPGFEPFQNFIIARPGILGLQPCITELMRLSQAHTMMHWTTPDAFLCKARWRMEELFREVKTVGGFGDYRQRSFKALKRRARLCRAGSSLLGLLALSVPPAEKIEAEPWWKPSGPASLSPCAGPGTRGWEFLLVFIPTPNPKKLPPSKRRHDDYRCKQGGKVLKFSFCNMGHVNTS